MECYISLEYNTFLSFSPKSVTFFFSPRHHLSSHAHTGGLFSLTQALTPVCPFPLPNYMFISLLLPLPFLPIPTHLQVPQFLHCCLLIIPFGAPIPGSQSVRQLQHTQLSTGFVCLGWAMLPSQISNLPSCWRCKAGHEAMKDHYSWNVPKNSSKARDTPWCH